MEYINDINIQEAVIHVLDSNSGEPILNEYKLEINEDVYKYLYNHIEKSLKSEDLKYAKFNEERNIVKEVVQDYLNGLDSNLIGLSQELARQLFIRMKTNINIPSCDLIIVSLITDQGPMMGILKLDYKKSFIHQIDFSENKVGVDLVAQATGLPASSQRIEKAAFIKPIRENADFDLLVLDKKKKKSDDEEYGSNYWINNFLGCIQVTNERDETRNFINLSERWIRQTYPDDAVESESMRREIRKQLEENETININEFAEEIIKEDGFADNFKMFMSGHVDGEIKIDKVYAEKKLNKIKLKIDKDIEINIGKEAYEDLSRFEISKNGDGSINMTIKNVVNYIEK
ncbi:MAG: nucleoid-associated protein [Clostridium sp.]|uniref:nucleoid-associated protein n=1 Tax=Clostridium sp. TaxID=1506 RepID=UPI002908A13E|nr:nucleoid-associated protein [Clostridium sp.]MDU7948722.1 nucleoid-associated protein [Clostridium sp.]